MNVQRQRGAALVVSLIVLLVVTLLGLSTLESAVMQERMASNAQNKNLSFQTAESLLETAMRDEDILGGDRKKLHDAITRGIGDRGDAQTFGSADGAATAEYQLSFMGETKYAAQGQERSFNSDIPVRRYEMRMSTTNSNTQASSVHTQGFVPN